MRPPRRRTRRRPVAAASSPARAAARSADHDQGRDRGRGRPLDRRCDRADRPRPGRRRATAVAQLKAAGAIVFGKTNVPRWSGDLQTYNEIFGTTNNPWDVDTRAGRLVRRARGGRGRAGFTSFELGTDIGGSVRIPSHCCGVFGLKPSYGVVPQRGYLDHVGGGTTDADINVFGPIARSADDLDLLLSVLAAPEPERRVAWRLELPPPRHAELASMRIGVWFDEPSMPDRPRRARAPAARRRRVGRRGSEGRGRASARRLRRADAACSCQLIARPISPSMAGRASRRRFAGSHRSGCAPTSNGPGCGTCGRSGSSRTTRCCARCMPTPAIPHDQEGDFMTRTIDDQRRGGVRT